MISFSRIKEYGLVLIILFAPQASFVVFYSAVIPYAIITSFSLKKNVSRDSFIFIMMLGLCIFSYVLVKYMVYGNLFDFKELMKVILFFIVYSSFRYISLKQLEFLFFAFVVIDCLVSVAQFIHIDLFLVNFITSVYSTENHIEFSLHNDSVRSLGLSPGPGQHGVISLVMVWFFFTLYFFDRKGVKRLLGALFPLLALILSQSKTSLIALLISGVIFVILIYVHKRNFDRMMITISLLSIFLLGLLYFQEVRLMLYGVNSILESGLQVSSLMARYSLWENMINEILASNPVLILFGAGRSFLEFNNVYHNSFDSDYVYVFVSYGLIGFVGFVGVVLSYLIKNFFRYIRLSLVDKVIYLVLLSGSISALSIAFFIDLKIISILALMFAISHNQNTFDRKVQPIKIGEQ